MDMHYAYPTPRPASAPDFFLSTPQRSVRTQGVKHVFTDPYEAASALAAGEVEIVVGAIPFDTAQPCHLVVPETVTMSQGPLEPPACYRSPEALEHLTPTFAEAYQTREQHEENIRAALATMETTDLEKVVLSRTALIRYAECPDPLVVAARLIGVEQLGHGYFLNLSPADLPVSERQSFMGASPETLIATQGGRVHALPLAGSAPHPSGDDQRSADVDATLLASAKDRVEHQLVVDHYRAVLEPVCRELRIEEPRTYTSGEVTHIGTAIEGQLPVDEAGVPTSSALDLALMLHPTPAVGGTPTHLAQGVIAESDSDRQFYAGAVGWCSANGDGQFMVSIRCCEMLGVEAQVWAGGGIVPGSEPEAELQEIDAKMRTALRAMNVPPESVRKL